jgi:hypothetical protein
MNEERNNEAVLLGVVSHVLSFAVGELCKYSFLLAFEKELSDLKGLVKADSIFEKDIELLAGLKDPAVQLLLCSINKVVDHIQIHLMINRLDEYEVMADEICHQHASNNFHFYIDEGIGQDYEALVLETLDLYFSLMHLIFHTAFQLRLKNIDLPDNVMENFYFDFLDVLDNNMPAEDKNVQLLYGLIVTLNDDATALAQLT